MAEEPSDDEQQAKAVGHSRDISYSYTATGESQQGDEAEVNLDLHAAVESKDAPKVKEILDNRPNLVNIQDDEGQTPLHIASKNGAYEICEELLKHRPDTELQDKRGIMPLHLAVMNGFKDIIDLLSHYDPEAQEIKKDEDVPSGGDQVVNIKRQVYPPNKIICYQRNTWVDNYLEKIEFVFESNLKRDTVKIGLKIPEQGDNVMFISNDRQEMDFKKNKYYTWMIKPNEQLVVCTATRTLPKSGKPKKMGFGYMLGYKWRHRWHWK